MPPWLSTSSLWRCYWCRSIFFIMSKLRRNIMLMLIDADADVLTGWYWEGSRSTLNIGTMRHNLWQRFRGIQQIINSYRWARFYKCLIYKFPQQKCWSSKFWRQTFVLAFTYTNTLAYTAVTVVVISSTKECGTNNDGTISGRGVDDCGALPAYKAWDILRTHLPMIYPLPCKVLKRF